MDTSEMFLQIVTVQGGTEFMLIILYAILLLTFRPKQLKEWATNCVSDYKVMSNIVLATCMHIFIVAILGVIVIYGYEKGIMKVSTVTGNGIPPLILILVGTAISGAVWFQLKSILTIDKSLNALVCLRKLNLIKVIAAFCAFSQLTRVTKD